MSQGPSAVPGFLLWHTTTRWRNTIADALAPLDLTPTQFFLLGSLHWLGRSLGRAPVQRELADHAGLDRMMTSQLTRALAARGLLLRKDDPADTRAFRISLTPAGTRLTRRAIDLVQRADARFFAPISGERETFRSTLARLARAAGAGPNILGEEIADE